MRFIAEESFKMYDEYNMNKANGHKSLRYGLAHAGRQNELLLAMEHNVKAEWIPRYKFLNEIKNRFCKDSNLYNAFKACRRINNGLRKLSLFNINVTNFFEFIIDGSKIALKSTAIMTIGMVVVVGAMQHMVDKGGRDIGYSPKSESRYRDVEGNLYDENGNRVPW